MHQISETEQTTLAICIPTFNRRRYLANLLEQTEATLKDFPYSFEIIISDNASDDGTEDLVRTWTDRLPIRFFRQPENVGPFRNLAFVLEQSTSVFSMYLADDDLIDGDGLKAAIGTLQQDPEAVILYAPWTLVDLINDRVLSKFYDLPADTVINQGNFLHLLLLILQNHIFAEISIVRTEAFRRLLPREADIAHFAFTVPGEYLTIGKVLFQKQPFYKSVTGYFADEQREQGGVSAAEQLWDRYRGGLEHLFGLSLPQLKEADIPLVRDNIREFIVARMLVALRLRINLGRDPIETYYLASRLRGLGAASRLPKPLNNIRAEAALWFLTHDETMLRDTTAIVLVGGFDPAIVQHLQSISDLDVSLEATLPEETQNAIVIIKNDQASIPLDTDMHRARNNKIIQEDFLMNKFL